MFGMGFTEILLIAVVAIIALGPEKLPTAMVDIAKFIKKMKDGIDEAKTTLDNEIKITDMRKEAEKFKSQILDVKTSVTESTRIDVGLDNLMDDISKIGDTNSKTSNDIIAEQRKKSQLKEKELEELSSEDNDLKSNSTLIKGDAIGSKNAKNKPEEILEELEDKPAANENNISNKKDDNNAQKTSKNKEEIVKKLDEPEKKLNSEEAQSFRIKTSKEENEEIKNKENK